MSRIPGNVALPPPSATVPTQFKTTNVWIKPAPTFPGNYADEVTNDLQVINGIFPQFFSHLNAGRQVNIVYQMPGANQIVANTDGCVVLRDIHYLALSDSSKKQGFANQLRTEMTRAGLTEMTLAQRLQLVALPGWKEATTDANPFTGVLQGTVASKIRNGWLSGDVLPTHPEMDALVLESVLPGLARGPGCNVRINYDPRFATNRPAVVGLFHELVHAYYCVKGANLGIIESSDVLAGGRHFELMAVGMSPYQNKRYSENRIRPVVGCSRRTVYP